MELKDRQAACARTEKRMLELLMHFVPAENLKVADVQYIAQSAGRLAFDEFSPKQG